MQKLNQRCPFNSPNDFYTYYTSTYGWRRLSKNTWIARTDTILAYHYSTCKKLSCNLFFVDHAIKSSAESVCLKSTFVLFVIFSDTSLPEMNMYSYICMNFLCGQFTSCGANVMVWNYRGNSGATKISQLSEDKGMLSMTNSFPSFPSMPFPPTSEWRRSSPFHSLSTQHIFIMFRTSEQRVQICLAS